MAYNFLPCDRNQTYLLPLSLTDWLPEDHLAWFVLDAVEQIDLSQFYKKYRTDGVGNSAFNPSMMVGLLIYSYCTGKRSSRRIEKHCQTDVAYKVITANQSPDHSTISRFRKNNESQSITTSRTGGMRKAPKRGHYGLVSFLLFHVFLVPEYIFGSWPRRVLPC